MLNISRGIVKRAQKVVLYGVEGIGKTTLASQAPDPLFIDTESGTTHLDVKRIQKPETWEELISVIKEVADAPTVCSTLVIDTADWAETMAIDHICLKYKQPGLEAFGYGKGYTYLSEEFTRLLTACDKVIESGKHVIITAHAKQRKVELPDETGSFDVWGLKLSKQTAPLLKEWPDALLFLNYKTYVITTEEKTRKAQGGKRVIYTTHSPVYDAKNRHGLAPELELKWESIAPIFTNAPVAQSEPEAPAPEKPKPKAKAAKPKAQKSKPDMPPVTEKTLAELKQMMEDSNITAAAIQQLVGSKGHFPEDTSIEEYPEAFVTGWIFPNWGQIVKTIINDPNYIPF